MWSEKTPFIAVVIISVSDNLTNRNILLFSLFVVIRGQEEGEKERGLRV